MGRKSNVALGTLLIAGASYVAGVLTAPKSGKETRKDLHKAARKAKMEAERKLKIAHSELTIALDEAALKLKKSKVAADKEFQKALDTANTAKNKARELLSAMHEGEADDKDLQKAVTEAKAAAKHLKQFIGKPAKE